MLRTHAEFTSNPAHTKVSDRVVITASRAYSMWSKTLLSL